MPEIETRCVAELLYHIHDIRIARVDGTPHAVTIVAKLDPIARGDSFLIVRLIEPEPMAGILHPAYNRVRLIVANANFVVLSDGKNGLLPMCAAIVREVHATVAGECNMRGIVRIDPHGMQIVMDVLHVDFLERAAAIGGAI